MSRSKTGHKCLRKKYQGIWMTAYDAPTARLLESSGAVDAILVGDSVGTVLLGHKSTQEVTSDEIIHHTNAVLRSVKKIPVFADIPFKTLCKGIRETKKIARDLKRIGCFGVKIESIPEARRAHEACIGEGIRVIGHTGLTPQSVGPRQHFKARGITAEDALAMTHEAFRLQDIGVCSVVLECIAAPVSKVITDQLNIPTIGIGSGRFCNNHIAIFQDVIGLTNDFKAKFSRSYSNSYEDNKKAVSEFIKHIKQKNYPSIGESYSMNPHQFIQYVKALQDGA